MAEYIDREAVYVEACRGCIRHGENIGECYSEEPCQKLIEVFALAPVADVAPVVHGGWDAKIMKDIGTYTVFWCSKCNCVSYFKHNYCPNCGAKMDGGNNNV